MIENLIASRPKTSRLIVMDFDLDFTLNGRDVGRVACGVYDLTENKWFGHYEFNDVPEFGNAWAYLSSTSVVSSSCCIGSRERMGAQNLLSLIDNEWSTDVRFSVVNKSGEMVGHATQRIEANIDRSEDNRYEVRGSIRMNGQVPLELPSLRKLQDNMKGYAVYLRQVAPGQVEGTTAYPFFGGDSEARDSLGTVAATRNYNFGNDRTLPFPEIQTYSVESFEVKVNDGKRVCDWMSQAYYAPLGYREEGEFEIGAVTDGN